MCLRVGVQGFRGSVPFLDCGLLMSNKDSRASIGTFQDFVTPGSAGFFGDSADLGFGKG